MKHAVRPIPAGNHAVPASGRAPPCLDALAKRAIQRQFAHRKIPAGNHAVPASGKAPSLPSYVCKTSALKLGACDAWTQGGGMCFACRSGATARRAGPRGTLAREVDVRTTRQAARDLGPFLCHGGHFSGATKPKHVPPPFADVSSLYESIQVISRFFQSSRTLSLRPIVWAFPADMVY